MNDILIPMHVIQRLERRWSAKLEYLHYDLGTAGFSNVGFSNLSATNYQTDIMSAHFSGDIVRAGINYHIPAWGPGSGFSH